MKPEQNSNNTLAFVAIAMVILIGYQVFVVDPAAKKRKAEVQQAETAQQAETPQMTPPSLDGTADSVATAHQASPSATLPDPIAIETPSLQGSINLLGGRFDDLELKGYRQTIEPNSPLVRLFGDGNGTAPYFAAFGWTGIAGAPSETTIWQISGPNRTLTADTPVTLTHSAGGLSYERTITVDEQSMFTITDTVTNGTNQAVQLAPFGVIRRQNVPEQALGIAHEGFIGWLDGRLEDKKYKKIAKKGPFKQNSETGWLGLTDKYWMAALVPDQSKPFAAAYSEKNGIYTARYVSGLQTLAPGQSLSQTERLFAGAKDVGVIETYAESLDIPRFDLAVDWGMFWFFTKPFFHLLDFLANMTLSWGVAAPFGIAILLMTVLVKLVFFPLANQSYAAMSKMKKVQPQVDQLRTRYKGDFEKLNKEMMALYKREKINPMAGCLPIFIQIPVFFALYKVLFVSLEMRHAPFYGWVNDLSAPDPTSVFNLFGLLPYDPTVVPVIGGFLALGAWPLLMGCTMWLQQQMNPPAQDPVQRKIMAWLPVIFTFIMAPFAAGLVIYWTWSNVLSVAQQYWIMRKYQVDTPFDSFLKKLSGKSAKDA